MVVKICGITNPKDALAAVEMGATALGFIFYPKSPRRATVESLTGWIGRIPTGIWKVGVFVDEKPERVESICSELQLDIAQLHGSETPLEHPQGVPVWKAFRMTEGFHFDPQYPADAILLDGAGSGRTFDWSLAANISRPLIVAGGLDEHNVRTAIEQSRPWGVDVASGIETAPGRKDHTRMKRFIEAALNS